MPGAVSTKRQASRGSFAPLKLAFRLLAPQRLLMVHGGWLVLVIFVLLLSASGIGMALRPRLRDKHRSSDTVDHVQLVVSILVTLTALALSLVLTNMKASFDTFDSGPRAFAS